MTKNSFSVVAASLFVLLLAAPSVAWQGRMAGVGDADGLIEDESDYLTHPAIIAAGSGLNSYGNYRLTYDQASKWDYSINSPASSVIYPFSTSGHSWKNEGQVGAAFSLGTGRMGVFFDYTGIDGKYSGDEGYTGFWYNGSGTYDFNNKIDNFALKVIYGMPVQAVKLGAEFQIAYRNEEQETNWLEDHGDFFKNYLWAAEDYPEINLYPFMIPYKSKYWEAQGKISVAGSLGPAKYTFTLKGGIPFASDNNCDRGDSLYTAEGKVKGFHAGGDFWLRTPLNDRLILPFVVSAGYKTIKRDGVYDAELPWIVTYEHEAKDIFVKVGGGVDFTPANGTKVAAGLYYDFIRTNQNLYASDIDLPTFYVDEYTDMPKYTEHRWTLKTLAEKELSSMVVLRGGFNVFYGIVKSDYAYSAHDDFGPYSSLSASTSGSNMGVNVSAGATVKLEKVSLEPFINAGYVKYRTSGDGTIGSFAIETEFKKDNWLIGGGLSAKF
jgi:hypothetical protein